MVERQHSDGINFASEYESHQGFVVSFLIGNGATREEAEDVSQDAWIKAMTKIDLFDSSKGPFQGWIATIARNTYRDKQRRDKVAPTQPISSEIVDLEALLPDMEESIEVRVGNRLEGEWIKGLVSNLPSNQREVINSNFFGQLSHGEIAQTKNIPLGTVKTRSRLGIAKIKSAIINEGINKYDDIVTPSTYEAGGNGDASRQ